MGGSCNGSSGEPARPIFWRTTEEVIPAKAKPEFIELLPGVMAPGSTECIIEWSDGVGSTLRMHIKGANLSELASLAGVFRGGRT